MGIPTPIQFDDDVCDALGELANMIGGNLKSVLPRGVSLSLPSVVQGNSYSLRVCGGHRNNRMSFTGPDGPFWVTLVETET
jgi:chemotaxis protein CheX